MSGVALGALGMLGTLTRALTFDALGPISDNTGGVAELAQRDEWVSHWHFLVSLFQERGLMDNAFAFANKNAICTESSYIYTGTKGTYLSSSCIVGLALGSVTGFKDVTVNSVGAHMDALVQEPVSIAIGADSVFFQSYSGGPWSPFRGLWHRRQLRLQEGQEFSGFVLW